jgi:Uma2 family endonuclease
VIEVLSPRPRIGDSDERVRLFAEHNVRECWLVHQDRQEFTVLDFGDRRIRGRRIHRRTDSIGSRVLPDFSLTWEQIFADD